MSYPIERVFVAVDMANIFKTCQEQYGRQHRINFKTLLNTIKNSSICKLPRHVKSVAYMIVPQYKLQSNGTVNVVEANNKRFSAHLEYLGFAIKNRDAYIERNTSKTYSSSWGIGITVDAINLIDTYDTFSLVVGDGDFSQLIEHLKEKGKYTEIVTFEGSASRLFCSSAHRTLLISEGTIYSKETDGENSSSNSANTDQTNTR